MVVLTLVRHDRDCMMRRSKTSVQLKSNATRRSSLQVKSPYFWNAPYSGQETPRRSLQSPRPDTTSRVPFRRRSVDCTYHIVNLADATDGMKNLKLIEMSDKVKDTGKKSNHLFPPIPAKSWRNPRLLSAKSSSRSEKSPKKKPMQSDVGSSSGRKNSMCASNELLASEHSQTDDFCHGLPDESKVHRADTIAPLQSQKTFLFGNKNVDAGTPRSPGHARTSKLKTSSLHSRSSEGSCNSAVFRAKAASRRRASLPVTPSNFVPATSREFHKAFKELSRQGDMNTDSKRSNTTSSLKAFSDKVSTPASSSTPREAMTISTGKKRDSLHRIEEIPVEPSAPVCTVKEETKDECDVHDKGDKARPENNVTLNKEDVSSNPVDTTNTGEDSINLNTGNALDTSCPAEDSLALSQNDNVITNSPEPHEGEAIKDQTSEKKVTPLNKKALNAISKTIVAASKAEIATNNSIFDDDDSVIDAAILDMRDEDLCDADFREKRIIQWIITAETGENVEQQVVSEVGPSPTFGSRETAITIIYNG